MQRLFLFLWISFHFHVCFGFLHNFPELHFHHLPPNVLESILTRLDVSSSLNMRLASHNLKQRLDDANFGPYSTLILGIINGHVTGQISDELQLVNYGASRPVDSRVALALPDKFYQLRKAAFDLETYNIVAQYLKASSFISELYIHVKSPSTPTDNIELWYKLRRNHATLVKSNVYDENQNPILHQLVLIGNHSAAMDLINAGADVEALNGSGTSLITLVACQAGLDLLSSVLSALRPSSFVSKQLSVALREAILLRRDEIVQFLLLQLPHLTTQSNEISSLLMAAIETNEFYMFRIVFNHFQNVDLGGDLGLDLISRSASLGNLDNVQFLFTHGAPVNSALPYGGINPLISSISNQSVHVTNFLVNQGSYINYHGSGNWTALMLASKLDIIETVRLLITKNVELDAKNADLDTALSIAIYNNHKEIVEALLVAGADPNCITESWKEEYRPLWLAVANGNNQMVQLLLNHGADYEISLADGTSLRNFAYDSGYGLIVKTIDEHHLLKGKHEGFVQQFGELFNVF